MHTLHNLLLTLSHCLPAETSHALAARCLQTNLLPALPAQDYPSLHLTLLGKSLPHPVGLAAGFDKHATMIPAMARHGFSMIETGTVTPKPQPGNPKPRLFRLSEDKAIINRFGFNSVGIDRFLANVESSNAAEALLGINLGKNKLSSDPVEDYVTLLERVYTKADYITINISSPNTPNLRALQSEDALESLLKAIADTRQTLHQQGCAHTPVLVKIAPDIATEALSGMVEIIGNHAMDGIIVSNTTIQRPASLTSPHTSEAGGLSGAPLYSLSTDILAACYRITKGAIPLIGVGGIQNGLDAYQKIRAGANAVQLYTALIYQGFAVIERIKKELAEHVERDGFTHISEAVGTAVQY